MVRRRLAGSVCRAVTTRGHTTTAQSTWLVVRVQAIALRAHRWRGVEAGAVAMVRQRVLAELQGRASVPSGPPYIVGLDVSLRKTGFAVLDSAGTRPGRGRGGQRLVRACRRVVAGV